MSENEDKSVSMAIDEKLDLLFGKLTSEMGSMENRLKKDMTSMEERLQENMNSMEKSLKNDLDSMKGELTSVKGDISSMKGELTSVKGDISSMKGELTSVKGDISSMEERVKYDINVREQKLELQLQQVVNRPSSGIDGMGFVEGLNTAAAIGASSMRINPAYLQ